MNTYRNYNLGNIINNVFSNSDKYNFAVDKYRVNNIIFNILDFLEKNETDELNIVKNNKKILDKSEIIVEKTCQYVYIKGDKKGDKCGRCIRNKNRNRGHNLCATHLKTIDTEKLFKLPQARISPECIELENEPTLNKLWHKESGIVFENKKAIGRYHHRIFFPITNEIIKICDVWNFKY